METVEFELGQLHVEIEGIKLVIYSDTPYKRKGLIFDAENQIYGSYLDTWWVPGRTIIIPIRWWGQLW